MKTPIYVEVNMISTDLHKHNLMLCCGVKGVHIMVYWCMQSTVEFILFKL